MSDPTENNDIIDITGNDNPPTVANRKTGRALSEVWAIFTKVTPDYNPAQMNYSRCNHCTENVSYQKKIQRVKDHLCKGCPAYKKKMMELNVSERPDWYIEGTGGKRLYATPLCSTASASISTGSSLTQTSTKTKKTKKQKSMKQYTFPKITKDELERIEDCIAMHYYITGTSFMRVEEKHLLDAFRIARPGVELPSQKRLANELLDRCYKKIKKMTEDELKNPAIMNCITTDGTTNIKNLAIINYMLISSNRSLFLESKETGTQSHDAEFIATDLSRVISGLEKNGTTVVGAVTDNTTTNKSAWAMLKEQYPEKFFHGCASHGLHLIVKDVFAATKTRNRITQTLSYPDNYPFEYLMAFVASCKSVVSFFSKHQKDKAALVELQGEEKRIQLVQPAPTRWGTLLQCFKSLKESEAILHQMVNARDFISGSAQQKEKRQEVKNIICNEFFVKNLDKSIELLTPIQMGITMFQSDTIALSEVYRHFAITMHDSYSSMRCLTMNEKEYMVQLVKSRLEFMYGDAIGLSYLLDPKYMAERMDAEHKLKAQRTLRQYGAVGIPVTEDNVDERRKLCEKIFKEYLDWTDKTLTLKSDPENQLAFYTPKQYWNIEGFDYPALKALAVRVFGMVASSAASERGFSTMSFIHSKLRNRLSPEKVKMLIYIKTNAPQLLASGEQVMDWGRDCDEDKRDSDEDNDMEEDDDEEGGSDEDNDIGVLDLNTIQNM